jgi:hypothetical protein
MNKFFPTKWSIMCAVMNGVSDLKLALAVHEAGAMPSLMIKWKKGQRNEFDYDLLNYTLGEFVKSAGNGHCVLQLDYSDLKDEKVLKLVEHYQITHVEILGLIDLPNSQSQKEFELVTTRYQKEFDRLKNTARVITRIFVPSSGCGIDCYALKGSESAGCSGNLTVKDLFVQQHNLTPHVPLIPYGGIGTPKDVAWYLSQGAAGVAVGTLFAASEESCLDLKAKQAMVDATSQTLKHLTSNQQALVIGEVSNDSNHQQSLDAGIRGQGGLIYAGHSINYVTEIRSVKTIIEYLVSDIK